jgi:hypothetical protein
LHPCSIPILISVGLPPMCHISHSLASLCALLEEYEVNGVGRLRWNAIALDWPLRFMGKHRSPKQIAVMQNG